MNISNTLSRSEFDAMYEANGGFISLLNKNHPYRKDGETVLEYLECGARRLAEEEPETIRLVAELAGFGQLQ